MTSYQLTSLCMPSGIPTPLPAPRGGTLRYGIIGGLLSYLLLYLLLLGYDLLTAPLYNKSCRDILAAAKPDVLKPRAVLLEEELAMHRLRIEKLEKEMQVGAGLTLLQAADVGRSTRACAWVYAYLTWTPMQARRRIPACTACTGTTRTETTSLRFPPPAR